MLISGAGIGDARGNHRTITYARDLQWVLQHQYQQLFLIHSRFLVYAEAYLHGLPSHHTDATPTCGSFFMEVLLGTPAAYSIAYSKHLASMSESHTGKAIDERTWAPGKSWSFVKVDEYLFSAGWPSRVAPSGRQGKSRNRGCSGFRCLSRFDGSIRGIVTSEDINVA